MTIYKAIAEETHLKKPNVIRFKGSNKRFIIGRAKREVKVNAMPATKSVFSPFDRIIPDVINVTKYKENVFITRCLKSVFIY